MKQALGRDYIFSHAERKRSQKQRFPHEKIGLCLCFSTFVQLFSSLMSLSERVLVGRLKHPIPLALCCINTGNHCVTLQRYWGHWSSETGHVSCLERLTGLGMTTGTRLLWKQSWHGPRNKTGTSPVNSKVRGMFSHLHENMLSVAGNCEAKVTLLLL